MNVWDRRLMYLANLMVGGTGLLYAAMRYFMHPADEWAMVNHPWQPHVQHAHVLVAPLLVFACGVIWRRHVVQHWRQATRLRRSGPGLVTLLAPMVASGYLLQTSVSQGWRQAWIVVHVATSVIWLLAFAVHLLSAWRGAASREIDPPTVCTATRSTNILRNDRPNHRATYPG